MGLNIHPNELHRKPPACPRRLVERDHSPPVVHQDLVRYMMDYGLGVRVTREYEVLALDSDYFEAFL
jgi:hypothetical protein